MLSKGPCGIIYVIEGERNNASISDPSESFQLYLGKGGELSIGFVVFQAIERKKRGVRLTCEGNNEVYIYITLCVLEEGVRGRYRDVWLMRNEVPPNE